MILTGALIILILLICGSIVIHAIVVLGLTRRQALLYAPFKLAYRIRDRGVRAVRSVQTPVIYVVTHQSRLDPALMLAMLPDDTLHILDAHSATSGWLEPFRSLSRTIVFNPKHIFVSRRLVRVLKGKGRLAVYLPDVVEPDTRSFRLFRALSRIAMQANAAIVPIFIAGSRVTSFSLASEKDAPRRFLPRLEFTALAPMTIAELIAASGSPSVSASNALFDRVAEARIGAQFRRGGLFSAIRDAALRIGPDRPIIEDVVDGQLTYRKMLIGARVLAERFARMTAPGEAVGVLLPNTNGIVLSLIGLLSAGRSAAILNYTAGPANVTSAVSTVLIRSVVSSRAFIEKAGLHDIVAAAQKGGARMVWLEDVRASVSTFDKVAAALSWRRPVAREQADGPAVIMFTSGSEGLPKAVVLSHRNLMINAMQVEARLSISPQDRLLNVLPVFHSFGLTGGLLLPLLTGVHVLLYPSPLHYKQIPRAAGTFRPSVLIGTDSFLAGYAVAAKNSDFESLRFAVAGAEPVRTQTRLVWRERFGVAILEGFGMTETGPVVAVNTATHGREGTVGRPLPGISLRLEPVDGIVDGARLWLSGPNVMFGTISPDQPGVIRALATGWHDSGDIVCVDRDGFITIRGRARRFAKIAGEMISLSAVEMLAGATWPEDRHAAVSVPDARRGEKIVLVTTAMAADASRLRLQAKKDGVSELMLPASIITVDRVPLLASGKTDNVSVRRIAFERLGLAAAA